MAKKVKNVHWIKWWSKETIYGSYMTEPVESLGFLVKMCCLSAETRYPGYVQSEYQRGIPHHTLAPLLNIPLDVFEELLEVNKMAGRLTENDNGVIEILNWEKFQEIEKWDGNPATAPKPLEPEQKDTRPAFKKVGHNEPYTGELDDDLTPEQEEIADNSDRLVAVYGERELEVAMGIADGKNQFTLKYVEGILRKRKEEREKAPGKTPSDDPDKYVKGKYGHMVKR